MERWIKYYSSGHNILLVGEGDFSFSLSLSMAFGSATNIVATSLDSYEALIGKYKNAIANVATLRAWGATVLHGVDATQMKNLPHLRWKRYDRIIYNFPHAGFYGKEDNPDMIKMHRDLVHGFLLNASSMLNHDGEIHINHKITAPFDSWRIEDLGLDSSLLCIGQDEFKTEDYPWYRNKRGAGSRSDEPFPLGACKTFKFKLYPNQNLNKKRKLDLVLPPPPVRPFVFYNANPSSIQIRALHSDTSEEYVRTFGGYADAVEDAFGRMRSDVYRLVEESVKTRLRYMHGSSGQRTFTGFIGTKSDSPYQHFDSR